MGTLTAQVKSYRILKYHYRIATYRIRNADVDSSPLVVVMALA